MSEKDLFGNGAFDKLTGKNFEAYMLRAAINLIINGLHDVPNLKIVIEHLERSLQSPFLEYDSKGFILRNAVNSIILGQVNDSKIIDDLISSIENPNLARLANYLRELLEDLDEIEQKVPVSNSSSFYYFYDLIHEIFAEITTSIFSKPIKKENLLSKIEEAISSYLELSIGKQNNITNFEIIKIRFTLIESKKIIVTL